MRDDFGIFILSHGRPEGVGITIGSLTRSNYTGRWWIVLDTDDTTAPEYTERWGPDRILTFSKDEIARTFDIGDNNPGPRGVGVFARNAIPVLAATLGLTYYMQLDDDYDQFAHRFVRDTTLTFAYTYHLDEVLEAFVDWLDDTGALTVAFAQGGDYIGGIYGSFKRPVLRKAMNTFIARVDRPIKFLGRFNDDVTTYVVQGGRGDLFLTSTDFNIHQKPTAVQGGGMTEVYKDGGTYLKSFYTIMQAPSCVTIGTIGDTTRRVHHSIRWAHAVPKIVSGRYRGAPHKAPEPPAAPGVGGYTSPVLTGPQTGDAAAYLRELPGVLINPDAYTDRLAQFTEHTTPLLASVTRCHAVDRDTISEVEVSLWVDAWTEWQQRETTAGRFPTMSGYKPMKPGPKAAAVMGLWLGWQNALRYALDQSWERFIICEDDVRPRRDLTEGLVPHPPPGADVNLWQGGLPMASFKAEDTAYTKGTRFTWKPVPADDRPTVHSYLTTGAIEFTQKGAEAYLQALIDHPGHVDHVLGFALRQLPLTQRCWPTPLVQYGPIIRNGIERLPTLTR